jgi:hypothetical protein
VNVFAINAAAVNDSNEIWSWYGDAGMALQADGELIAGITGVGDANVVVQSDLMPSVRLLVEGSADVALTMAGEALYGRSGSGDMQLAVNAGGEGVRWTFGESDLPVVFQADGDAQVVSQVSASFNIQFEAEMDGRAATVHQGIADLSVVFDTQLDYRVARPIYLEGDAAMVFGIEAMPFMWINSASGAADIAWQAAGDARFGGVLYGEGSAELEWIATGDALQWHYHYAEGAVDIQITAVAERHGKPALPSEFTAAPLIRAMHLGVERRAFIVPAERRA